MLGETKQNVNHFNIMNIIQHIKSFKKVFRQAYSFYFLPMQENMSYVYTVPSILEEFHTKG